MGLREFFETWLRHAWHFVGHFGVIRNELTAAEGAGEKRFVAHRLSHSRGSPQSRITAVRLVCSQRHLALSLSSASPPVAATSREILSRRSHSIRSASVIIAQSPPLSFARAFPSHDVPHTRPDTRRGDSAEATLAPIPSVRTPAWMGRFHGCDVAWRAMRQ